MLSYPSLQVPAEDARRSLSSFAWLFLLILFILPFGKLQNAVLGGMTIAKLMIPVCSLLQIVWMWRRYKLHPHLPIYMVLIMLTTPSFVLGNDEYPGIFFSFLGYAILFQILYNSSLGIRDFEKFIKTYVAGLGLVSFLVILAFSGIDLGALVGKSLVDWWYGTPVFLGSEENPNAFAAYFVPGLTGVAVLVASARNRLGKFFYICAYLFIAAVLALTFSRSAALGGLLGTVVVYLCAKRRSAFGVVIAVSAITLVGFGIYASFGLVSGLLTDGNGGISVFSNKETSAGYRVLMLETAIASFSFADIFGIGYGNYSKLIEPVIGEAINSHNIFIGIGLEFGLLSLLLFLVLTGLTVFIYIKSFQRSLTVASQLTTGFYCGSLLGLIVHGLFHEIYINFLYWFMVASALPVYKAVRAQESRLLSIGKNTISEETREYR